MICPFCLADYGEGAIYRTTVCSSCGKDLKVCLNCLFYSPGSPYDCREPVSEPVVEKNRANFCDFFQPGGDRIGVKGDLKQKESRKAFDSLFGD